MRVPRAARAAVGSLGGRAFVGRALRPRPHARAFVGRALRSRPHAHAFVGRALRSRPHASPPVAPLPISGGREPNPDPHVGAAGTEAKVRGAVKLQKAIRRRQSRGIFAQIELNAREVPSPGKYESLAESTAGHAAFSKGERGTRFDGPQSFYAC